ncbi:MAG: ABC transporter permease [Chloroflexota bacterium]|nr:ABC transporter permease [Chloroflexota bacterium]
MYKLRAFVWKALYSTYTDRNLLLIMFLTPVALATIIALAFSNFIQGAGSDVVVRNIPVAIVNLDQGVEQNGTMQNNGQIFIDLLVPPDDIAADDLAANPLYELTNAETVADEATARAGVEAGDYAAAIIIPPDFSAKITYSGTNAALQPVTIQVYGSSGLSVSPTVIRGITESIAANIEAGNITIAATIETLIARAQSDPVFGLTFAAASVSGEFQPDFAPAFDFASNPIQIEAQTVSGEAVALSPLVSIGSAISIFFLLFTGTGSVGALLEEQRDGTLGRLFATATPRWLILVSNLIGSLSICIVQVIVLFLALTIVSSLIAGQPQFIWGTNLLAFAAVVIAVSLAACGLGALLIGLIRKPEQLNVIAGAVSLAMGALGGAFFNVEGIPGVNVISRLSLVYWGSNAFQKLSLGDGDIGLNLIVLLGLGAAMFVVGLALFNRRLNA